MRIPLGCAILLAGMTAHAEDAAAPFATAAADFYKAYLEAHPGQAVSLGYHEYDGRLPDVSPEALAAEIQGLHEAQQVFEAFPPGQLPQTERLERAVILGVIRNDLFELEVLRDPWRSPRSYAAPWVLTDYISRDYAPLEQRARALVSVAKAAPGYFENARKNLEPKFPRPWLETAIRAAKGGASFIRGDVRKAMAGVKDRELAAELDTSLESLAKEIDKQQHWLEEHTSQATDDYALGADVFLRMLSDTQGITLDLPTLKKIAEADLQRNLTALATAAHEIDPIKSVDDVLLAEEQDRPAPSEVIAEATRQVAQARQFLIDRDLVTIPSNEPAEVLETPPFMRFNFAFLDPAGVFETKPLPSFYYVSPPDPEWPAEKQRDYVRPRAHLLFTTVHEVWPGHFLDYLHRRRVASPILKSFGNYSRTEGWAHYVEEMMAEEGVAGGGPKIRIGQLKSALVRNCRTLAAIGLHAEGMTVPEAIELFERKGYVDEGNAQQQAVRGTFDPMYLSYTLGKLVILKLREDWKAKMGSGYSLKAFHDTFLSFGPAPLLDIRREMLGEDSGPPL